MFKRLKDKLLRTIRRVRRTVHNTVETVREALSPVFAVFDSTLPSWRDIMQVTVWVSAATATFLAVLGLIGGGGWAVVFAAPVMCMRLVFGGFIFLLKLMALVAMIRLLSDLMHGSISIGRSEHPVYASRPARHHRQAAYNTRR